MTLKEQIVEVLRDHPGLSDREITNASAVSDAPHSELQVDFGRRAGRVRYSCLKESR